MPADSFSEVSSQSWLSRLGSSLVGILIGLILILVAIGLLTWNEGRAVKRAKALEEGAGQVIEVAADQINAANEGRLIHVSGRAETEDALVDPVFGVGGELLKLRRVVEMYQWREERHSETREKLGGGTETVTTYSYEQGWESRPINSSTFKRPEGHSNPARLPYPQWSQSASPVTLGAFRLSSSLIAMIDDFQRLSLSDPTLAASKLQLPSGAQQVGDEIYLGDNPSAPQVGDTRIYFEAVAPQVVSLVSVQRGSSFVPYQASNGNRVELLEPGVLSAQQLFEAAQDRNRLLTWGLRLAGFMLMFFGFRLVFGTLRVLAAVVPALGRLVGGAISLVAAILAAVISLITIAIAWLFYRPLLGAGLLIASVLLLFGLRRARPEVAPAGVHGASASSASPPPPPPPAP